MENETQGALKRIIEEVKEYRRAECLMKDCIVNRIIGGNDIDLVEKFIAETEKDIEAEEIMEGSDSLEEKEEKLENI